MDRNLWKKQKAKGEMKILTSPLLRNFISVLVVLNFLILWYRLDLLPNYRATTSCCLWPLILWWTAQWTLIFKGQKAIVEHTQNSVIEHHLLCQNQRQAKRFPLSSLDSDNFNRWRFLTFYRLLFFLFNYHFLDDFVILFLDLVLAILNNLFVCQENVR